MPISLSIDFDVATASISSVACRAFFIYAYIMVRGRTGLHVGLFISLMRIFAVSIRCCLATTIMLIKSEVSDIYEKNLNLVCAAERRTFW